MKKSPVLSIDLKIDSISQVIARLRKLICGKDEEEGEWEDDEVEERDFESSDEDEMYDDQQFSHLKEDWEYPHKDDMKFCCLKTEKVGKGKYDAVFGPYKYGKTPERNLSSREGAKRRVAPTGTTTKKKKKSPVCAQNKYRSYTAEHDSCSKCVTTVENKIYRVEVRIKGSPITSRVSIPESGRHEVVRQTLRLGNVTLIQEKNDLNFWIFTPTHTRVLKGYLNLNHNMVDSSSKDEIFKSFVHVLVVRAGEFEDYCKKWSSSHVIMELPVEVPQWFLEYGDKCTAEAGKIGYARKYVQAFAQTFKLGKIFMLDDNVPEFFEVDTCRGKDGKEYMRQDESEGTGKKKMVLKNIPLYQVLKQLEGLHDSEAAAPKENYRNRGDYTGSPGTYGVIGIEKRCGFSETRIKRPFKNTHVYKVSLININALRTKGIEYKPWEVWEDLRLNNDCDQANLYVVKFNRYAASIRNWSTWQPDLFIWDGDTNLGVESTAELKPTSEESNFLLRYIRDWAPPGRYEDSCPNEQKPAELSLLVKKIGKLLRAKHHFAAVHPDSLKSYLQETPGLSSFEKHILVLSKTACVEKKWATLNDFEKNIIEPHFESIEGNVVSFKIGSSHNVKEFDVKIILIYVEGKSK